MNLLSRHWKELQREKTLKGGNALNCHETNVTQNTNRSKNTQKYTLSFEFAVLFNQDLSSGVNLMKT